MGTDFVLSKPETFEFNLKLKFESFSVMLIAYILCYSVPCNFKSINIAYNNIVFDVFCLLLEKH